MEDRLGKLFGWARVDPLRYEEPGATTYCLKYLLKTLRQGKEDEVLWQYLEWDGNGRPKGV